MKLRANGCGCDKKEEDESDSGDEDENINTDSNKSKQATARDPQERVLGQHRRQQVIRQSCLLLHRYERASTDILPKAEPFVQPLEGVSDINKCFE